MDTLSLMKSRHSVRRYQKKPIPQEIRHELDAYTDELNRTGGLHIQILYDEPECFSSRMAKYGKFENADNYIAMVGSKSPTLDERCGYFGELLVLKAQQLGLNTCWVALTHGKSRAVVDKGEKEVILISLGYGQHSGHERRSKCAGDVSDIDDAAPEWYRRGIEGALLAPTAVNQQKFRFHRDGDTVAASTPRIGTCLQIDLGIVKCHFELLAGKENFRWK